MTDGEMQNDDLDTDEEENSNVNKYSVKMVMCT